MDRGSTLTFQMEQFATTDGGCYSGSRTVCALGLHIWISSLEPRVEDDERCTFPLEGFTNRVGVLVSSPVTPEEAGGSL